MSFPDFWTINSITPRNPWYFSAIYKGPSPMSRGLPVPRWARSAYDRGLEEIHDFLDLLWGFSFLDLPKFRFVKKNTPFWRGDFFNFCWRLFLLMVVGCWLLGGSGSCFFFFGGGGFYVRYTCYQPLKAWWPKGLVMGVTVLGIIYNDIIYYSGVYIYTHRIHAWFINLHLDDFYGKCR